MTYPGVEDRVLSYQQIEQLWTANGGSPQLAPTMAAIAEAESGGGHTAAFNPDSGTGDYSVGLWQINYFGNLAPGRTARYGSPQSLAADPNAQARAAIDLAAGGRGLGNWTTYTSGAYRRYLNGNAVLSNAGPPIPGGSQPTVTNTVANEHCIVGPITIPFSGGGSFWSGFLSGLFPVAGALGIGGGGKDKQLCLLPTNWARAVGGVLVIIPGVGLMLAGAILVAQSSRGLTGTVGAVAGSVTSVGGPPAKLAAATVTLARKPGARRARRMEDERIEAAARTNTRAASRTSVRASDLDDRRGDEEEPF